jgi:hypothetical protein
MHLDVLLSNKQSLDTCASHISLYGVITHSPVLRTLWRIKGVKTTARLLKPATSPISQLHCLISIELGTAIYLGHLCRIVQEALRRAYPGTSSKSNYSSFKSATFYLIRSNEVNIDRTLLLQLGLRRRSYLRVTRSHGLAGVLNALEVLRGSASSPHEPY